MLLRRRLHRATFGQLPDGALQRNESRLRGCLRRRRGDGTIGMKTKLLNFVLFQSAWFGCVLSAARGLWWVPPLCALSVCVVYVSTSDNRLTSIRLLGVVISLGTVIDVVLWKLGVVSFTRADATWLSGTIWFASLWAAFATTLQLSLAWLQSRSIVAMLFGAIGGPLAYLAGERLGAIAMSSKVMSMSVFAIEWAILTPVVMMIAVHVTRKGPTV